MRFTLVTILPELFDSVLSAGVVGRAREAGRLQVDFVNPRDFTHDRHRSVDDTPAGGGPGMVMTCEPLLSAIAAAAAPLPMTASPMSGEPDSVAALAAPPRPPRRLLMSPAGAPLTQARVRALAGEDHLILVCGRYEGIDERVAALAIDEEVSIGDFVLSGGELAALAVLDAVARHVPGVLGEASSADDESFADGLLEYPQYTRPAELHGLAIPEVLASGHHQRIHRWRRAQALARTARRRPDLLARHVFTAEDIALWATLPESRAAAGLHVALVHHPVLDRTGATVTSAVTNVDIHDIARIAAAYGAGSYRLITPVAAQREKVARIAEMWNTDQARDHRLDALSLVHTAPSIADVVAELTAAAGQRPLVVATSAVAERFPAAARLELTALRRHLLDGRGPVLLLFGTGWGLADAAIPEVDAVLPPLVPRAAYNHLPVRAAVAIMLDRLWGPGTG